MTALTSLAPALNLPTALPLVHAPMLGPEWLDAANLITTIVKWFGPWAILGVMLVIFAETGLLVGFLLPGDYLLFTLGMFVAMGEVDPAKGVLLVGGAVPGPKGSVVVVRTAVKSVAKGA